MTVRGADARAGSRLAVAFGWVAVVPAATAVAARAAGFERGPFALLVALSPWALVVGAIALALAVIGRSAALGLVAVVTAVPVVLWNAPLWTSVAAPEEDPALTVASVSLTFGRADADEVVALVREHHVDVLAVQELTPEAAEALVAAGLEAELPHAAAFPEPGFVGTGLWSRSSLADIASIDGFVSRTVSAQVDTASGPLTVIAPHPAAPGALSHEAWTSDTEALTTVLTGVEGPALVLGDLNLTRDHAAFRDLLALGYADAADQAGSGLTLTFPQGRAPFPLVAIDHALVREAPLVATAVTTTAVRGADHRALVVTYSHG
ncbi:endonuclease/exonuclease/phosphatase family protein [Demequina sp. NBRC 110056]|uniref:endonuclease/exonuclease/phosphatase family protein n=1 Tax=Demequina sp. NBRC 110056 TaxID=1570345 RepID=UPI00117FF3E7|nr:endonuclease/exonuclease/phosphatase family protein [Demequina sp. NBRC 110056]